MRKEIWKNYTQARHEGREKKTTPTLMSLNERMTYQRERKMLEIQNLL